MAQLPLLRLVDGRCRLVWRFLFLAWVSSSFLVYLSTMFIQSAMIQAIVTFLISTSPSYQHVQVFIFILVHSSTMHYRHLACAFSCLLLLASFCLYASVGSRLKSHLALDLPCQILREITCISDRRRLLPVPVLVRCRNHLQVCLVPVTSFRLLGFLRQAYLKLIYTHAVLFTVCNSLRSSVAFLQCIAACCMSCQESRPASTISKPKAEPSCPNLGLCDECSPQVRSLAVY